MAIVTGGSPAFTGVYYDVPYSRNFDPPAQTTGNGLGAGTCTANAPPTGTTTEYEEGIDIDQTKVSGGAPGAALTDGGIASIDTQRLVRDPSNQQHFENQRDRQRDRWEEPPRHQANSSSKHLRDELPSG